MNYAVPMSIDVAGTASRTLSDEVADEIRAQLGRQRISQAELARRMGVTAPWLNYRLTGTQPIDVNDLDMIAAALNVSVATLLPGSTGTVRPLTRRRRKATEGYTRSRAERPSNRSDLRRPDFLRRALAVA